MGPGVSAVRTVLPFKTKVHTHTQHTHTAHTHTAHTQHTAHTAHSTHTHTHTHTHTFYVVLPSYIGHSDSPF